MKVVLGTNVFISGIFFTGPPFQILSVWRDGIVVYPEVLEEYRAVRDRLSVHYPGVSIEPIFALLVAHVNIVRAPPIRRQLGHHDSKPWQFHCCFDKTFQEHESPLRYLERLASSQY